MLLKAPSWASAYVLRCHYKTSGRLHQGWGVDCIGLYLGVVEREAGIALPEYDGPPWRDAKSVADLGQAARAFAARFEQVPPKSERAFDAVLLRMRRQPIHIGCVIAEGLMLHIEEGCNAVIESYRDAPWPARIVGFYRPQVVS